MLNFRAIGFKRTCLRPILILPAALPCLDSELEQHHIALNLALYDLLKSYLSENHHAAAYNVVTSWTLLSC